MDNPAVSAGFVAGGLALVGTLLPWDAAGPFPTVATVAGGLAFLGFAAARYGFVDDRVGAGVGALGGGALAGYATVFGVGQGAVLAGAGGVGAALAAAVRGGPLRERLHALGTATLAGVAGYLVIAVWVLLLQLVLDGVGVDATPFVSNVRNGAATLLGGVSATGAFLTYTGRDWGYVDLPRPDTRDVIGFVGGAAAIAVVVFGYSALFTSLGVETAEHTLSDTVRSNPELLAVLIPSSLLFVGPGEELLYRNVVQKRLAASFPDGTAILVASAVFSGVHLSAYVGGGGSLGAALLSVFTLSLVLGAVYAYTESLLVAAAVHGCYDAVVFAAIAAGVG